MLEFQSFPVGLNERGESSFNQTGHIPLGGSGLGGGGRRLDGDGPGGGMGNWRFRKLDMQVFDGSDPDG